MAADAQSNWEEIKINSSSNEYKNKNDQRKRIYMGRLSFFNFNVAWLLISINFLEVENK